MKKKHVIIGGLCAAMAACLVAGCAQEVKPYDESGFGGSSNNESNELVTDKKIKLDGKLDDECWQNQKPFAFTYQDVSVTVTTVFGELGFYVGYEVEDSHVYAVEGRDVWKGSSVEMYVDRGDATKKSERTFQYRLGALDQWELLYGYETKEDSWSATYLPVFGKTQVQGTVNSGSTQGMTAEIFVRWDALGYDFTAEDFVAPESVKIMPVYNQSSGAEMDSARAFWANNGGDIGNPMQYWIFNGEGFADADEAGATIGDGSYGRAKTPGWDITKESQGIVKSKTAGDQSIFFTNVYATDYAVTALVEFKDALYYWANGLYWQKDPYPKAGLILASDTTIQAYLLNYDSAHRFGTPEGMFFRKGNPDPRETWQLYDPRPLTGLCDASGKVRLTGVKVGRYLLVFVGGADEEQFGGTFVGMQEVPETAGTASPGFYTLGCEVEFTDYAATTDSETVTGLANSVLSVLKLDQKSGGALGAGQLGYQKGESAVVTVKTYENYKLTSLKVNGEEKINELTADGELTVSMSENEMTVTPVFERVDSARLAEGTLNYIEKNAPANSVAMLVTGTAKDGGKVFLDVKPSAAENNVAEWYANLPDGTYTARVLVDGIYRASKEFTVDGGDVTVPAIDTPFNWVFTGGVEPKKDGSVTVRGYNQYREVTNRSATDYFAMTAFHYRDDGIFNVEGTWETGGFGVKVDGTVYRMHAMRANAQEIYLYIEVDGGANQEYRGIYYPLAGTGAPLQMDVFYMNGEFRFIFGGTTTFVVNAANTPNQAIHPLFDTAKTKNVGFITVGKDMVFKDYDFAFNQAETEAMYEGYSKGSVVLPENVTGLTVSSSVTEPSAVGTEVTLTFTLEGDYTLTALTVNGVDMLESVRDDKLTFTLKGGENVVTAEAAILTKYAVTGTLGYAEGLYTAGDVVNITSRGFRGTLSGENWTISLPDGTHEVTFESSRFRSKTVNVTVNGGAVTVEEKVTFTQFKFDNAGAVQFENETTNDFKIVGGHWTAAFFEGITAGTGIRVDAHMQRADGRTLQYGDWQTGGLYLGTATKQFIVFVKCSENSTEILFGETTVWNNWWWYTVPQGLGGGTGDPIDISYVYLPGSLTVMLNNKTVATITKDTVGTGEGTGSCTLGQYRDFYNEFFATDISAHRVGLRLAHSPSDNKGVNFTNVKYAPVTAIPADFQGSVKLPTGVDGLTVTAENDKLSGFVGEKVTLNFNLDEGKTIKSLTLGGKDVLSELSGGKLTVTLTAGEQELEVVTEGVSVFAVTGTLGYAEGLYATGDTVTISSGSFVGTLTEGNWTIKLPDGPHTVTFASSRYLDKTVEVTVNGAAVTVSEQVVFSQIKFTQDSVYERDGNDVLTPSSPWTGAYFAGIDAANGIRADIALQREDGTFNITGTWGTGGFMLKKNGVVFMLYVMRQSDSEALVYLQNTSTWTFYEYNGINVYMQGTGAPVELSLVYLGDEIHLLVDNKAVLSLNASNYQSGRLNGSDPSPYAGLFTKGENDTVSIGVATMDTNNASKIRYTKLAYELVTAIPADFQGSVKLPESVDGLQITAENDKLSGFIGEKVTLNFTLDEGKTITSLTLDGKDVLSELSGGKLTVTLTAGEHELAVVTEGVSVFAVTGTLGYAEGLYATGDTVSISSGSFTGTLEEGNWTIKLPNGTYTVTFASERYESVTAEVTVNGAAVAVSEQVVFTTIKFSEGSVYERDGNDVLTPTAPWTGAYFAGINAAEGIRVDANLQRDDGNFGVSGGWGTGGFMINKNGVEFLLFVMKLNDGDVFVYLQNKSTWATYEYQHICLATQGTGAPIELSLVYLGDEIHLLIAKKAVLSLNASNYQSGNHDANKDFSPYAGLFVKGANDNVKIGVATMDTGNASKIRYTKLAYSGVTALPDDMKTPQNKNNLFDNPAVVTEYVDGKFGLVQGATYWLKDPTGAKQFLTSGAQGDFVISYSMERIDKNTGGCSTLEIYFPTAQFSFFVQRNGEQTCFNMAGYTFNIDYNEYGYMGAPITISVAYSSNDSLFHILLGGKHYTLQVTNIAGAQQEILWAQNEKILGFGTAYAASIVSDISYSVTKAEVDNKLSTWGTAENLTVTA